MMDDIDNFSYKDGKKDNIEVRDVSFTKDPLPNCKFHNKKNDLKFDHDKVKLDLIPIGPMMEIGKVLTYGAKKYKANSWQTVNDGINRYYAALLRHLFAWRSGESIDKESGLHHLSHMLCNAMFLCWLCIYKKKQ